MCSTDSPSARQRRSAGTTRSPSPDTVKSMNGKDRKSSCPISPSALAPPKTMQMSGKRYLRGRGHARAGDGERRNMRPENGDKPDEAVVSPVDRRDALIDEAGKHVPPRVVQQ